MSKISAAKYYRKMDYDKDAALIGSPSMFPRPVMLPAQSRADLGKCKFCTLHVFASPGQINLMLVDGRGNRFPAHKACRKR